jgi:isocitrate dehydrogenase
MKFEKLEIPPEGKRIEFENGKPVVADRPIIPIIHGDGVGPDVSSAARKVVDAAIAKAYGPEKRIVWLRIYAGEEANRLFNTWLPDDTVNAIDYFNVTVKGPLTTPVGGGYRSLTVTLRQKLDLYACIRPVRYFKGVPAPVKRPELLNVVVFRENTEDVYAGIEWQEGSEEARKLISFLSESMGRNVRPDSGIGIKPISITGTKRLVRSAIQYAIDRRRKSVTLVHKGNIMKFTEGAFRAWGYEAAKEFGDKVVTEEEVLKNYEGKAPRDKVVIKDRIADSMFQQILLRPDEYDVIATPNLNGDYLSDACAAQVGGLGMAPGANINFITGKAVFEATHGTAPKYAGLDKVNPGSMILSSAMMLEYLGWSEPARIIEDAMEKTISEGKVTYDLARQMEGATELKTSEFAQAVTENMLLT